MFISPHHPQPNPTQPTHSLHLYIWISFSSFLLLLFHAVLPFYSLSLLHLCCMFMCTRPFNFRINKLYALKSEHNFYAIVKTNPSKSKPIGYILCSREKKKKNYLYTLNAAYKWNECYDFYIYTKWELLMDFHLLQIHNCFFFLLSSFLSHFCLLNHAFSRLLSFLLLSVSLGSFSQKNGKECFALWSCMFIYV